MGAAARRQNFYLYDWKAKSFLEVRDGTVAGRSEGELRFPTDHSVSRRQCMFQVVGNEIYIQDFGSTNHTRVNDVPLDAGRKRRIRLDDVLQFGRRRFTLTHQKDRAPGNVRDATSKKLYLVRRTADGSLTRSIKGTRRTLVLLGRDKFRGVRVRSAVRRMARGGKARAFALAALVVCAVGGGAAYWFGLLR
jgi:hypothetical protein